MKPPFRFSRGIAVAGIVALALVAFVAPGVHAQTNGYSSTYAKQGHFPGADSKYALGYKKTKWKTPFWERTYQTQRPVAQGPESKYHSKLGVYVLDSDDVPDAARHELVNALQKYAASYGLILLPPSVLSGAVKHRKSCATSVTSCLGALATYPGIRALLVVHLAPGTAAKGGVQVETRLTDADFSIDYPPATALVALGGSTGQAVSPETWAQTVLDKAAWRVAVAPWLTHGFKQKHGDVYLSAGKSGGLSVGTELLVHAGGAVVRSPAGKAVAWQPGQVVGKLKVKQLLGKHIAMAQVVSGRAPQPQDEITLTK